MPSTKATGNALLKASLADDHLRNSRDLRMAGYGTQAIRKTGGLSAACLHLELPLAQPAG